MIEYQRTAIYGKGHISFCHKVDVPRQTYFIRSKEKIFKKVEEKSAEEFYGFRDPQITQKAEAKIMNYLNNEIWKKEINTKTFLYNPNFKPSLKEYNPKKEFEGIE